MRVIHPRDLIPSQRPPFLNPSHWRLDFNIEIWGGGHEHPDYGSIVTSFVSKTWPSERPVPCFAFLLFWGGGRGCGSVSQNSPEKGRLRSVMTCHPQAGGPGGPMVWFQPWGRRQMSQLTQSGRERILPSSTFSSYSGPQQAERLPICFSDGPSSLLSAPIQMLT